MIRKIRKELNLDLKKLTKFIGCNSKGAFYIENTIADNTNKTFRYLLYLRKRRINVNKLLDEYLKIENNKDD